MIIDKQLQFCVAQDETTQADHISDQYIDATKIGDAEDENLLFVAQVNTAYTSNGAATLQVKLQTSNDTTDGSNGTWATLIATDAIALATLVAGKVLVQANIPRPMQRFLRVLQTIGTTAMTAGSLNAFLTTEPQTQFNHTP